VSVEIRIPTLLRRHVNNQSTITADGSTLREVLDNVGQTYPALTSQLVSENGDLHKFLNIYLNDDDVRFLGQLDTPIKDGDSLTVLPAVAGG
jgi:sulfur-carrier protein